MLEWLSILTKKLKIEKRYPMTPATMKAKFPKDCIVEILDNSYDSCSIHEMMDLSSTFPAAYTKYKNPNGVSGLLRKIFRYREERFDCDEYAFLFKVYVNAVAGNLSMGIVHVKDGDSKHSLNFFIDKNNQFYYIEPQSGKLMKEGSYDVKEYKSYWCVF